MKEQTSRICRMIRKHEVFLSALGSLIRVLVKFVRAVLELLHIFSR
jgi:hypothetical protein